MIVRKFNFGTIYTPMVNLNFKEWLQFVEGDAAAEAQRILNKLGRGNMKYRKQDSDDDTPIAQDDDNTEIEPRRAVFGEPSSVEDEARKRMMTQIKARQPMKQVRQARQILSPSQDDLSYKSWPPPEAAIKNAPLFRGNLRTGAA